MTDYFNDEMLIKAKKQRKKVFLVYMAFLSLYFLICLGLFIWYWQLPYKHSQITLVKWITFSVTAIFIVFSFIYLGIPYKRVNKFYKLLLNLKTGLKESTIAEFIETDSQMVIKDGVECKELVFNEWNKFKNDFYKRKVYVFYEFPFPEMGKGDKVNFITQGNVLIKYEIQNNTEDKQ